MVSDCEASTLSEPGRMPFCHQSSDRSHCFSIGWADLIDRYTIFDIMDDGASYQGNEPMCLLPAKEYGSLLGRAELVDIKIERVGRTCRNGEEYFELLSVGGRRE